MWVIRLIEDLEFLCGSRVFSYARWRKGYEVNSIDDADPPSPVWTLPQVEVKGTVCQVYWDCKNCMPWMFTVRLHFQPIWCWKYSIYSSFIKWVHVSNVERGKIAPPRLCEEDYYDDSFKTLTIQQICPPFWYSTLGYRDLVIKNAQCG